MRRIRVTPHLERWQIAAIFLRDSAFPIQFGQDCVGGMVASGRGQDRHMTLGQFVLGAATISISEGHRSHSEKVAAGVIRAIRGAAAVRAAQKDRPRQTVPVAP